MLLTVSQLAAASEALELPLTVESGQRFSIEYVHTKRQQGSAYEGQVRASLEIVDARAEQETMTVTWTTEVVSANGFELDASSPGARDYFVGVPVTVVADADLAPIRLADRDKLQRQLMASELFDGLDAEARQQVGALFSGFNDQGLAALLLKVPGYLSICHNTALVPGEPIEYETELPAPMGDTTIAAIGRYEVDVTDDESARVRYSLSYDPDSVMAFVRAVFTQLPPERRPPEEEIAGIRLQRTDTADCSVSRASGWVTRMTFETTFELPDGERRERYDIDVKRIQ